MIQKPIPNLPSSRWKVLSDDQFQSLKQNHYHEHTVLYVINTSYAFSHIIRIALILSLHILNLDYFYLKGEVDMIFF